MPRSLDVRHANPFCRFMIDGIIQMREENALADTNKFDVMIDVIKFVLHILECDPEDNSSKYLVL